MFETITFDEFDLSDLNSRLEKLRYNDLMTIDYIKKEFTLEERVYLFCNGNSNRLLEAKKLGVFTDLEIVDVLKLYYRYLDDKIVDSLFFLFSSDDVKINNIVLGHNNFIKCLTNLNINYEFALKFIGYVHNNLSLMMAAQIIGKLDNDLQKLEIMDMFKTSNKSFRIKIICSLQNDNLKKKYLFPLSYGTCDIICSFKSDDFKMSYLNKYSFFLSQDDMRRIIESLELDDDKKKYLRLIKSDEARFHIIMGFKTDEFKLKFIKCLNSDIYRMDVIKSFKTDDLRLEGIKFLVKRKSIFEILEKYPRLQFPYLKDVRDYKFIRKVIEECNFYNIYFFPSYSPEYDGIVKMYADHFKLNFEHLNKLIERVGYGVLKYLENENIVDSINLNDSDFNKYLGLFDVNNIRLDINCVNDIFNSLLQREFRVKNPDIFETFILAKNLVLSGKKEEITRLLGKIGREIYLPKLLIDDGLNLSMLIEKLFSMSKDEQDRALELLNKIVNQYIVVNRNRYVVDNLEGARINGLARVPRKNCLIKAYLKKINSKSLINIISSIDVSRLTLEQQSLVNNKDLLMKIIRYKKFQHCEYLELNSEVKGSLKLFDSLFSILYESGKLCEDRKCVVRLLGDNPDNYEYVIPVSEKYFYFEVMNELNPGKLKDTLFRDDYAYEQLIKILNKYKFLGWGKVFSSVMVGADLVFDNVSLAGLINNFTYIYSDLWKKNNGITLTSLIDMADVYSSDDLIYSKLLGEKNYRLIRLNPFPYASQMVKDKRLKECTKFVRNMYNRTSITVLPFDKDFDIGYNRKINVVLGNVTNMQNLTYGERTGACMRIGGIAKTLFNYCINNENGFHIRFSDPDTGAFISRVSCFRYGNTVFLNQLCSSTVNNYSDKDIIIACKQVAQEIIADSNDSEYPIDNVVVGKQGAMKDSGMPLSKLRISIADKVPCYTDIWDVAIVLATRGENGRLVPISLADKKLPRYGVQRDKISIYETEQEIGKAIEQIQIIDQILGHTFLDNIQTFVPNNLVKCYRGEDWYLAIDSVGKTYDYVAKHSRNRDKAFREIIQVSSLFGDLKDRRDKLR